METERNEVYERIPWETLEQKRPDRQWVLFAVAGAIVLGALAYSYVSSQPAPPTAVAEAEVTLPSAPVVPVVPEAIPPAAPATTGPMLVAEADLYAVDPERLLDRAAAHAEWFAAEYITADDSEQSAGVLASLLPTGIPMPTAPEGVSVFVESTRAFEVAELAPSLYRVEVLVRSLRAGPDDVYARQPPLVVSVEVAVDGLGARVTMPPSMAPALASQPEGMPLGAVPETVAATALTMSGGAEVVGGAESPRGGWDVVVMAVHSDGVTRPTTVRVP